MTLFGWYFGRLPGEQQRYRNLLKQLKKIMATLDQAIAELKTSNEALTTANGIIAETKAIIIKVGGETDKLKSIIDNLPPAGDAPQELVDEIDKLKATIAATSALVGEAKEAVGVVDAKVEDA